MERERERGNIEWSSVEDVGEGGGGKQFRCTIKFSREFLKPTCRKVEIGVVKRDETESSISRVDRLFLEQREAEKPWPTSFRDSVGNTR